ncbi:NADH dehydrogenase [ubiquinone] 1 alpha subcomplex subunit 2 [Acyrthosiphon pisum]|uniref:NADH dehydrogenase [ubiquinone] 1 alpha subcomplex subunit 2 n=1 Tax=Acyrthosiphon pisum TaxID=7029 RepID=A0A8R2FBF7_ACYPI|nr:NADH dehydrogenase [ubiquinone] 1 alpha subcomplex subunit 2 [Acyrthosiphon pisum]|eukprot:XP_008187106.1 PREDICTED: NADH dehydrogenase [ubiquinone] 1 alpha subcomplex subunit 2 [Acyrthosiphon pisum]
MSAIKFGSHLKELRLHLCQSSSSSKGVRQFIEKYYIPMKKANPKFPILVRECSGVEPKVFARFEFGQERSEQLSDQSADNVLKKIEGLVKQ